MVKPVTRIDIFNIMAHWIRHIMPICVYPLEVEWMNIHWIAPLNIEKYEGGGFIHLVGSISNRRQSSRRRWHPAYRGDLGQVTIVMDPHYALFFGDLQNSPIISTNMPMASSPRNAVSKPLMTVKIPLRADRMHPIAISLIFIVCLIDYIFFTARLVLDMKMVYFGCLCLYYL